MRSIRHLTPRYVYDRLRWGLYQRRHPDTPWLTPDAVRFLETLLRPDDIGLELGSGRSTLWFARRMKHLTSIEHVPEWYEKVRTQIDASGLANVSYHMIRATGLDEPSEYTDFIRKIPDGSLGFGLSDGAYRDLAPLLMIPKMAPGGLLVIDNVNWFLDHPTRSPSSRMGKGVENERWQKFQEQVADWRFIWTSSGVSDTAIYFAPGGQPRSG